MCLGLQTGDLVKDWRRINVSFTRARSKLIIFGSRQTLQATPLLKGFFDLMDEKGWVLSMPDEAHTFHGSVLRDAPLTNRAEIGMEVDMNEGLSLKVTLSKRSGEEGESGIGGLGKDKDPRPVKKMRKSHGVDSGILKGKPVLQDVINDGL